MKEEARDNQSGGPASIFPGQVVEVRDPSGRVWLGTVDVADEAQGIIWIHDSLGERKLVELAEHAVLMR